MSLVTHAADACAVAGHLWDQWVPRSVKAVLSAGRPDDEMRAMTRWLAATHDTGKASPAFACQVEHLASAIRDTGLKIEARRSDARPSHSVVGHRAIEKHLVAGGWAKVVATTYAVVAGGHHGVPPEPEDLIPYPSEAMYGGNAWDEVRDQFLRYVAEISGASRYLSQWQHMPLTAQQQALWTGVVILSDWLASDSARFPLGEPRDSDEYARSVVADLELPPPWRATAANSAGEAFSRFGLPLDFRPNALQISSFEAARQLGGGGLLIIEAEMGVGKTEAALMSAEELAAQGGQGGIFIALPTMATSNAMFGRVLAWLLAHRDLGETSMVLAHGKADLNDGYRGLFYGSEATEIDRDGPDCVTSKVIAHQWLSGRKKGLLANFGVGTIDQLLFMALKTRHVTLRHLALAGKVVIVDEVHAADVFMRQYLLRALNWLGAYGVPVVLLSATLPIDQRAELVEAYGSGAGTTLLNPEMMRHTSYPSITSVATDGQVRVATPAASSKPRSVSVVRLDDTDDALRSMLNERLSGGGCAAVIRNTVRRAQETAAFLRAEFNDDVVLVHSAFCARHRTDREAQLLGELGRKSENRPVRRIVVGTQVVEQSLDYDFDVMITDLAPIDLLLQRIGRLHRHARDRPIQLVRPTVYITGVQDWSDVIPTPIAPSANVYELYDLLRAVHVLGDRSDLSLPGDIPTLVQAGYSELTDLSAEWVDVVETAKTKAANRELVRRTTAQDFLLKRPKGTWVGALRMKAGDAEDPHGYARVRDGNESLEVVLVRRVGNDVRLPDQCGGHVITVSHKPDDRVARKALGASIRLPYSLSRPGMASSVILELEKRTSQYIGWRESKWLSGELALELDEDLETTLCGYRVRYDDCDGLVVTAGTE